MDHIARAVDINRALIYRHFESKDELFVLTITRYLDEITARGLAAVPILAGVPPSSCAPHGAASAPTAATTPHSWTARCRPSPRRPAEELRESVSDGTLASGSADR